MPSLPRPGLPITKGQCPGCGERRLRLQPETKQLCCVCGWHAFLTAGEDGKSGEYGDLLDIQIGLNTRLDPDLFLHAIGRRVQFVEVAPEPTIYHTQAPSGAARWNLRPRGRQAEPAPRRAARLDEQGSVNEVRIAPDPHHPGSYLATSNRRSPHGGPAAIYALWEYEGRWWCGCPQGERRCTHLQRLATYRATEEGAPLPTVRTWERQDAVTGNGKPPAQVQAAGNAAADLLFEG